MAEGVPFTSTHYASIESVRLLIGTYNESVAADTNSDGDAANISMEEDQALSEGDIKVDSYLLNDAYIRSNAIAVPAPSSTYYRMVQYAAARFAAVAISRYRGQLNINGKLVEQYAVYLDEAEKMLDRLILILRGVPVAGTFQFIPTADPSAATPTDENTNWPWG